MSHALPDPSSDPVIQHFLQYIEAHKSNGISATVSTIQDRHVNPEALFVTDQVLRDYFADGDQSERLVRAALKGAGKNIRAKDILKKHLLTFATLTCIGKGEFATHFLSRPGQLSDKQLPFWDKPAIWPVGVPFDDFAREQWRFCPLRFEFQHKIDIEPQRILPIQTCEEIGRGGSAIAYRITIHPDYDDLCEEDSGSDLGTEVEAAGNSSPLQTPPKSYVLKTYYTEDAKDYYDSEIEAFDRLRLSGTPRGNIIGYYGSFQKGDTYNILLEYADQDTLEHYFERVDPPNDGQDILNLWQSFFRVIQGVQCIHDVEIDDVEGPSIFQGWHQDIKPTNILVCSRGKTSPYEYDFKLADLGLSHFLESKGQVAPADVDSNGTRAYGAPECYRDRFTQSTKLKVKQRVDIWSLGCVFSEVAVWLVLGRKRLMEYRQIRRQETNTIHDFRDHGCFHDSKKVLTAVTDHHERVSRSVRSCDFVTKPLVGVKRTNDAAAMPGMINYLLCEAEARLDAVQLLRQADDILKEARLAYNDWLANLSSPRRSETLPTKRSPPVLPPGPPHSTSDPILGSLHAEPHRLGSPPELTLRQGQRPLSAESESYNTTNTGTPSSHKTSATSRPSTEHRIKPQNLFGQPDTSVEDVVGDPDTPTRCSSGYRSHGRGNSELDQTGLGIENGATIRSPTSGTREQITPIALTVQNHGVPPPVATRKVSEPMAKLSVQELLEYLPYRKDPYRTTPLKGKRFLKDLEGRDYIFLIDNAESMRPHWEALERLFSALGGLLKDYDKNGIDVYFTMSDGKHNFKHRSTIVSTLRANKPKADAGTCDITRSMNRILHEYREVFETKKSWRKLVKSLVNEAKPVTLLVFTDAVWQPKSDPAPAIKGMVNFLKTRDVEPTQVGIQFLRFGTDEELKKRLDRLDSGLGLEPDIVDAEPFDGNVWKMLLGSTNKSFDDDEDTIPFSPQWPQAPFGYI